MGARGMNDDTAIPWGARTRRAGWAVGLTLALTALVACGAEGGQEAQPSRGAAKTATGSGGEQDPSARSDAALDPGSGAGSGSGSGEKATDAKDGPAKDPGGGPADAGATEPQDPQKATDDARKAAQDPQKGAAAALAAVREQFEEQGIHLDLDDRRGALDCGGNNPVDSIEFALVHRKGKTHEALLYTLARPSLINAALLMIGFDKGANVTMREVDPLPTREEVEMGAEPVEVFPPRGDPVWMTVRWTDEEDRDIEVPLEDMILDLATQTEILGAEFVFLGGTVRPMERGGEARFFADLEGNLISTIYTQPANHLVTIVHDKARSDGIWWTTVVVPQEGTRVQLVFHREETDAHRERARRIAESGPRSAAGVAMPNAVPSRDTSGAHQPVEPIDPKKDGDDR